jgi:hypothetical protein
MVFLEAAIGSLDPTRLSDSRRGRVNLTAAAIVIAAAVAIPVLLHVIRSNSGASTPMNGFARLRVVGGLMVTNGSSLFSFVAGHCPDWLKSPVVSTWMGLAISATLGFVALRPHALVIGLPLTLISWLMVDDLLWPPRLAISLTFFLLVGALAFASIWGILSRMFSAGRWSRLGAIGFAVLAVICAAKSFQSQFEYVPDAKEVYTLAPKLPYSADDRARAERLFGIYLREGMPDEPVVAVAPLFRFADGRNLFWWNRMEGRPDPIWILWDDVSNPVGDRSSQYDLVGRSGRFSLYKKK